MRRNLSLSDAFKRALGGKELLRQDHLTQLLRECGFTAQQAEETIAEFMKTCPWVMQ